MPKKQLQREQIVTKLRQVDLLVSRGSGKRDAMRQVGISEVTYNRCHQEMGGLKPERVTRLKRTRS